MNKIIIPYLNKKLVKNLKNITVDGIVYLGMPLVHQKNRFFKLGKDAHLRSGTVIYANNKIGENFHTGHNTVIRENNVIGRNVIVGANSYLGPNNKIGNRVRIHTCVFLESTVVEDNVIISPHVVFTNDPYPPCKKCVRTIGGAYIEKGAIIGAGVVILPGIKIGRSSLIGAGSVVTKDVPREVVVIGNPAVIVKKRSQLQHFH